MTRMPLNKLPTLLYLLVPLALSGIASAILTRGTSVRVGAFGLQEHVPVVCTVEFPSELHRECEHVVATPPRASSVPSGAVSKAKENQMPMKERFNKPTMVTYEECNSSTTVYKFDVDLSRPGEWLAALVHGVAIGGSYRIVGHRLQVIFRADGAPEHECRPIEEFLRDLEPLQQSHVQELEIGRDAFGYFLRETGFQDDSPAAPLEHLTRAALLAALNEMYPEQSGD